jgi:hypothetical protein
VRPYRKQDPHRPGIAPALGLRAGSDGLLIVSQTASKEDTIMNRITSPRRPHTKQRRPHTRRLELELLEARNLLSFTNVLVNDPNQDGATNDFTQSETSSVVFGNTIIVGYNDTDMLASSVSLSLEATGLSISTDGGKTFVDKGNLPTSANAPFADPLLARDQTSGTIYYASVAAGNELSPAVPAIDVNRSFDGGATFQTAVNAAPGFGADSLDKPWIAVDNFSGPGQGNVYLAFTDYPIVSSAIPNGIFFTRSTDGGQTWGPNGGVPIETAGPSGRNAAHGVNVAVGPDHAVYVFW